MRFFKQNSGKSSMHVSFKQNTVGLFFVFAVMPAFWFLEYGLLPGGSCNNQRWLCAFSAADTNDQITLFLNTLKIKYVDFMSIVCLFCLFCIVQHFTYERL